MIFRRKMKCFLSGLLAATLAFSVSMGLPFESKAEVTGTKYGVSSPSIVPDDSVDAGQIVTYDCVWFGSYPQSEVVTEEMKKSYAFLAEGLYGEDDLVADTTLYNNLKNAEDSEWDENGDITLADGTKYRRMTYMDAAYAYSGTTGSQYYKWDYTEDENGTTVSSWHYFKYEPVKWRVLSVDEGAGQALLLADEALDVQTYHASTASNPVMVTWQSGTVRSWLNGLSASNNSKGIDYRSQTNFKDSAFSSAEQSAIVTTEVFNSTNLSLGTSGGENTKDQIYLLSDAQVYGEEAAAFGFVTDAGISDKAKVCKSSLYAKAMGAVSNLSESAMGSCRWWLRTPGKTNYYAAIVQTDGTVMPTGQPAYTSNFGIRPALTLDLSAGVCSDAGTVCSDGTVNETSGLTSIAGALVTLSETSYEYDGTAKTPQVLSARLADGKILQEGIDFSVSYRNNTEPGTAIVLLSGIGACTGTCMVAFQITGEGGEDAASYDCVWFGSYPQAEVVDSEMYLDYTPVSEQLRKGSDVIVDNEVYRLLSEAAEEDWDDSGDMTLPDGQKYRRVKAATALFYSHLDGYYQWGYYLESLGGLPNRVVMDTDTWHYFKYEPVKWRLLQTDESANRALLLADQALDAQLFHEGSKAGSITWEDSTLRKWLDTTFINTAFSEEEQQVILNTTLANDANSYYGTSSGKSTSDRVFLLSEQEVVNAAFGFAADKDDYDRAKRSKSSTYAKARGVYSSCNASYAGGASWWLRTAGSAGSRASAVDYAGYINTFGANVADTGNYGVRPAFCMSLSAMDTVCKNAGTVSTSGSFEELTQEGVKSISCANVTLSQNAYDYDGTEKIPPVTVELNGVMLEEGKDYEASYTDNVDTGTALVTVTGIGSYGGKAWAAFSITGTDISGAAVTLSKKTYEYDTTEKTPSVTVVLDGTVLEEGKDYEASYTDNINVGTATVTVTGRHSYSGSADQTFTITPASIITATVVPSKSVYTYDGQPKKPSVTVTLKNGTVLKEADYKLSYTSNTSVGYALVTVTGRDNYSGTVKKAFTIRPPKTKMKKAAVKTKGVKLTWKAVDAAAADGYVIQYSTSKSFGAKKTDKVTCKGADNTSKTLKGLKKKTYYVRVRAYKTSGGTKYYSTWSAKQKVNLK